MRNAWQGWSRYKDTGKFAALLFAVILFLAIWFMKEAQRKQRGKKSILESDMAGLLVYSALMAAVCIFPPTAAVLMQYQTRFYDYEWIWSLVPMTAVIAVGGTIFLGKIWEDYLCRSKKSGIRPFIVTGAVVAIILASGSLGQKNWSGDVDKEERNEMFQVLRLLTAEAGRTDICLWAPRDIMECARSYSGSISLPYGRNMWDSALGAYTYETYDETRQELYQWMSQAEETGELQCTVEVLTADGAGGINGSEKQLDGLLCIRNALDMGVNCILLPYSIDAKALEQISQELPVEIETWRNGYYLLKAM